MTFACPSRFSLLASLSLGLAAIGGPGCSTTVDDGGSSTEEALRGATPMATIFAGVAPGTKWSALPTWKQRALARNAAIYLDRVHHDWGTKGLDEKAERVLEAPTDAMLANYDAVIGFFVASEVPAGFKASTDVTSAPLAAALKRLYVAWCGMHRDTLGELKDWDGGAEREMHVVGRRTLEAQKAWVREVDRTLRGIPASTLSTTERAIRDKVLFFTRQLAAGTTGFNLGADDLLQTGGASGKLYDFAVGFKADGSAIVSNEEDFLQALNALTFVEKEWTNVGTVDTFDWNLAQNVDPEFLTSVGFDPATMPVAARYVLVASWWGERLHASKDATAACTVYSPRDRAMLWDGFTATNLTNADGKTTLASYAASYDGLARKNATETRAIAVAALDSAFPAGSPLLTAAQKAQVAAAIAASTKPAALVGTITEALDAATGKKDASTAFTEGMDGLTTIGGTYEDGADVSAADRATVLAMWNDVRSYVAAHYAGYAVDIAKLLPPTVTLTTSDAVFTGSAPGQAAANVSVGLGRPYAKASLYATMIHEAKHAIDFASKAPVQGAAWEGGGQAAEMLVWPAFIAEVMASEAPKLPYYRLAAAIDNVRFTATTDATLQVLLRPSCKAGEPSSIDFVKGIIAGYGYDDPATQLLRSRRAHQGTQYLSYELGRVVVTDVITYLQTQVGPAVVVDPYLMQACNLSSAKADATAAAALKACIANKK